MQKFLRTLDLNSGFWQIKIDEESAPFTAFTTHKGLFEFKQVCFGLKNAPTYFQKCLDSLLNKLTNANAMVYIDDIIIWGKNVAEHLNSLRAVLQLLKEAKLKLKPSKCFFGYEILHYLGHIITPNGISPDPLKVTAIDAVKPPTNVKQLRRFLGMANYYRKFIENYSKTAEPLYRLLKIGNGLIWNEEQADAFNAIKQKLIDAPEMTFFKFGNPLVLTTDASGYALGACLKQIEKEKDKNIERIIGYYGRTLNETEKRYSATEREFLAFLNAIKHFRVYLFGQTFTVFTDNKPITVIKDRLKSASERIRRWFLQLYDYRFTIIYKEGKINFDADFLSRLDYDKDDNVEEEEIIAYSLTQNTDISKYQNNDVFCNLKIEELQKNENNDKNFIYITGILYHIDRSESTMKNQIFVPIRLRNLIIEECHNAAHFGKWKSYKLIALKYWWPEMREDIAYFIRRCSVCIERKQRSGPKRGQFHPIAPQIPLPVYGVFSLVGFDIIVFDDSLRSQRQNKYIFVAIDYLSHFAVAEAVRKQDAISVKRFLIEKVFLTHGYPHALITDQGPNIKSKEVTEALRDVNVKHIMTTTYHPSSNGLVEKMNGIIKNILTTHVNENLKTDTFFFNLQYLHTIQCHTLSNNLAYSTFFMVFTIEVL